MFDRAVIGNYVKLVDEIMILAQINLERATSTAQIKSHIKLNSSRFVVIPARAPVKIRVIHSNKTLIPKLADSQHGRGPKPTCYNPLRPGENSLRNTHTPPPKLSAKNTHKPAVSDIYLFSPRPRVCCARLRSSNLQPFENGFVRRRTDGSPPQIKHNNPVILQDKAEVRA